MDLLRASVPTIPEFASLSLVIKPETYSDLSLAMAEPLIIASPSSSIPGGLSLNALKELHGFVTSTLGRTEEGGMLSDSRVISEMFKDDQKTVDDLQTFRPLCTYGLGLTFRFIRGDPGLVTKLAGILLSSQKSNAKAASLKSEEDLFGIMLCVGISGLSASATSSITQYQIGERLSSCKDVLNALDKSVDISAVKTLMSTLLLSEDDYRITNTRADAANITSIPEIDETTEKARGLLGRRKDQTPKAANPDAMEKEEVILPLAISSADIARTMSENMKVLSVAESDTLIRKYAATGLDRKANLDLTGGGGKSRFNRKRSSGRDPDLDHFDYKGPLKEEFPTPQMAGGSVYTQPPPPQQQQQQQQPQGPVIPLPKKDTGGKKAASVSGPKGRRGKGAEFTDEDSSQVDPFAGKKKGGRSRAQFDDEEGTVSSQSRLQVNIALNEDLSCSYRSSQLSSCTVEGVVQVQVKSSVKASMPFFLLMRDPARHVESFVQNKKFADDVSDALLEEEDADRKFTVSVPKDDTYFPVVRYKCTEDLHPVPMRVQTRVKLDDTYCRVALQISSNPNNESKLVDLTIIMGVPEDIVGESLATQPAGGVWNSGKRCVTWCVEELGEGEKFQLQARFQVANNAKYDPNGEKPQFPVLVRCQCLFAQLSDVELEVRDIPDVAPADVTMKIARRFRLSHRERS
uniref:MHD domain-containing protein n=1 Tax=Amphora coffeiformis TaxID=265554 RepID=A0A7S3L338_9STRA